MSISLSRFGKLLAIITLHILSVSFSFPSGIPIMYIHFFLLVVSKKFHRLSSFFHSFFFFWLLLLDNFIYPVFLVTDSFAQFSLLLKLLHSSIQCILYLYCFSNFIKLSVFFDNSLKFKRIILNYLSDTSYIFTSLGSVIGVLLVFWWCHVYLIFHGPWYLSMCYHLPDFTIPLWQR